MKRFFIFLVVLAVALGGLYLWWQLRAKDIITGEVRRLSLSLVQNPAHLTVDIPKPVQMTELNRATVPQLLISGKDLRLKDGPDIAQAKLVLKGVQVSGPPFHFTGLTEGYYAVTVRDKAVTDYLRRRGVKFPAVAKIPLDTILVTFSKPQGVILQGDLMLPFTSARVPLNVRGKLVPSSSDGEIDFKVAPSGIAVKGYKLPNLKAISDSLGLLNPMVTVAEWPFLADVSRITTDNGTVTIRGSVTGVQMRMLP